MQLAICILRDSEQLEPVLQGLLDSEVTGATVIEGTGLAELVRADQSLFSGFRNLFPQTGHGRVVLALVSNAKADELIREVERRWDAVEEGARGLVLTVPVNRAMRLGGAPLDDALLDGRGPG